MKFLLAATAMLGLWLAPSVSRADISITTGNHPQTNEVNIHLLGGDVGTTVTGTADTTIGTFTVDFSSSQTLRVLTTGGMGQAHIEAVDNATSLNHVSLNNGSVSLASGDPRSTFEDFILNLDNGGPFGNATSVTLTVNWTLNGVTQTPTMLTQTPLGNGENFFTIVANSTPGFASEITGISFQVNGGGLNGFDELQQPRISFTGATAVVPEPSTLGIAGLGALGFLGYGLARRRAR
jgi:hypothetical protein